MSYSVYKHTFPNGKVYIGITSKEPEKRWNDGLGYFSKSNGKFTQKRMVDAIIKYGWDNVEHEVLYRDLNKEEAEQKEIELIAKYKCNNIEFGYNIASGGNVTESKKEKRKSEIIKDIDVCETNDSRSTKKDKDDFDKLYQYVHTNVLGYDKGQHFSKEMKLRLRGLSKGKYIDNNNVSNKASYSYEVIRYTFMACNHKIQNALKNNEFKDEMHKFNYILKIVEKNIDDVNKRVANKNSETTV